MRGCFHCFVGLELARQLEDGLSPGQAVHDLVRVVADIAAGLPREERLQMLAAIPACLDRMVDQSIEDGPPAARRLN